MSTDYDAIQAMELAQYNGTYVVALRNFARHELQAIELDTKELADKLMEALFSPDNKERFAHNYDYVAVWQGHTFYAAKLANGHSFTQQTFQRYLEEMSI